MKLQELRGPEQIRALKLPELQGLAEESRHTILETVSRTGGHLAGLAGGQGG